MKKILFLIILLFPSFLFSYPNGRDIIKKTEDILRGKSFYSRIKLTVINPRWTINYEMEDWEKGKDKSFIYIHSPAKDRGTTFLKLKYSIKMFIPRVNRVILIPAGMMGQSMLGSDFSYDDMVHGNSISEDYESKVTGEAVVDNVKCYVVELTPKKDRAVVYGKLKYYVGEKDYIARKVEFISKKKKLIKVMLLTDIKKMNGRLIPTKYIITNLKKKGHKTIMRIIDAKYDINIPDSFFTEGNMKRKRR